MAFSFSRVEEIPESFYNEAQLMLLGLAPSQQGHTFTDDRTAQSTKELPEANEAVASIDG